jgi:hypothetical protein
VDKTPFSPRLRTQSDVEQMWRRLMSPLGFSSPSLWMAFIDDERPLPQITEFTEMPDSPGDEIAQSLALVLENLATPQMSCAFLRTRPGGGRPGPHDLAWARTLYGVGALAQMRLATIHLAHDHDVLPIAVDDLLAEPA